MGRLVAAILSGFALWSWVGLLLLKFMPYWVQHDWSPLTCFLAISAWVAILVVLVAIFAGYLTSWILS